MSRPKWLRDLDAVKTTVEQARVILERNKALRKRLGTLERSFKKTGKPPKSWGDYEDTVFARIEIGCPHCDDEYCGGCAWSNYPPRGLRPSGVTFSDYFCLAAPFNGVTLNDLDSSRPVEITYSDSYAFVYCQNKWEGGKRALNASLRRCYRFVDAHIRWANDVIEKGERDV